jgi:hypothetical protein
MTQNRNQVIVAALLILLAMSTRLMFNALHIYGFSAVMAAGFFAGAYFSNKRLGLLVPLAAMILTDLAIGGYDWKLTVVVDGSLMLTVLLGQFYSKRPTLLRWTGVLLGSSTMFFLVTNAAVWIFGDGTFYPHTFGGLLQSYTMGLPFFRDRLIGDFVWSALLFGSYELLRYRVPKPVAVAN